ncbi:hypothetical protein BDY19DRAFT_1045577 [Irpex rosettiformis]|uniref:Uncharacterized protein n=1 Tax=Irpex rosettiformis TaxID=378272 RepID=A0ACB8UG65_9APHY|nr:hypothetical protein BDY19DRAFT_1045577 [Irpex rosettiformis]
MATQALLAIAFLVENQHGADDFFKPQRTTAAMTFPLDSSIPFKFCFESKSSPRRVPTLKYSVSELDADTEDKYLIWIQNYESASQKACRAALASALRTLANGRTLRQAQLNALDFM